MNLELRSEDRGTHLVLYLNGELTAPDSGEFKAWIAKELTGAPELVELDCRRLHFIDSTGLGALVFAKRTADAEGSHLRLVRISGWLRKFLEVTGLEAAFDIDTDEQPENA